MSTNCCNTKKINKVIEDLVKSFMHEYFGKGPSLVKVTKTNNKINIICKEFMTKFEKSLVVDNEGCRYVQEIRKKTFNVYSKVFIERIELKANIIIDKISINFDITKNILSCLIIIK